MPGCTFCEIVAGERSAAVVLVADGVTAFLDHRPLFPGHVLIVPDEHHATLEDLPPQWHAVLLGTAARVAVAVRAATGAEGTFVAMNNVVSQSVPHLHIHVVPRRRGDGLRGFFWPRTGYRDDAHRDQVRLAIATRLTGPA